MPALLFNLPPGSMVTYLISDGNQSLESFQRPQSGEPIATVINFYCKELDQGK